MPAMTRSLAGHMEDLDLDEVVRVISLSRRSGVLTVDSPQGSAELMFVHGKLLSGRHSDAAEAVGEVLQKAGVVRADELAAGADLTLEELLDRAEQARPDDEVVARAEGVLAENLKALALTVLLYRSGSFNFRVTESESPPPRYPRDTGLTITRGLDADALSKEARRRREGRQRDPLGRLGHAQRRDTDDAHVELVVIDDDDGFRSIVERQASAAGLSVRVYADARAADDVLEDLHASTQARMLVTDLAMPRADGRGILGGLEVLKKASSKGAIDRVFLALDQPHEDAASIAEELGAAGVLLKPQATNGALPSFAPFLNPVLERLGRPTLVDEPIDLVSQLRSELGESEEWHADAGELPPDASKSLAVLKQMLAELNDPSFEEEIPLLVLRFAGAFFSRGAIFHVHRDQGAINGIGAFGLGSSDAGRTVHSIRLPLDADTVFSRCIRERDSVTQPYFDSEWNNRLLRSLGGPRPREVYTAPVFSPAGLEAVLYCDNALDGRAFGDVALLEILLQQSGAAIEKWGLKLRLDLVGITPDRPGESDGPS
jgi:CheY-like chemotaxis protein